MHLILHLLEELSRSRCIPVIINGSSIDISQFLVESALRETDLPDLCQQMLEVILPDKRPILHTFLIDHIATNSILAQDVGTPLAELGGADTGTWVLFNMLIIS